MSGEAGGGSGDRGRGEGREVVRVTNLVKDFKIGFGIRKKRVLSDVSFSAHEGEVFGFVGPNGAGKTTTLKILMGLVRPTAGEASILGRNVAESEFRDQIGFLPENPYFYTFLTAREILDFYARLSGVEAQQRADRVASLLALVQLEHAADMRLKTFSKGMLQRVGVAQALVHDPSVVFLDEPMSGLDPIGRREIRQVIQSLRAAGKTVFMNTHILSDVETICDRVAIIVKGRIRRQGRIETLVGNRNGSARIVASGVGIEVAESLESQFGAALGGRQDRIEIHVEEKSVEEALVLLARSGARVLGVGRDQAALEDVFMAAVREAEAER